VLIDLEIRGIVKACYAEAEHLLAGHRPQLDALAAALLQSESLDAAAILRVTGLEPRAQLDAGLDQPSAPAPAKDAGGGKRAASAPPDASGARPPAPASWSAF